MGTHIGNSANNYLAAHREGRVIKRWKSWSIYGRDGNDTLVGGPKSDRLYGENGHDALYGGQGGDTLEGGFGNDLLVGYGGASGEVDVLTGGAGRDRFVIGDSYSGDFYKGAGHAIITDFRWQDDKIQISGRFQDYRLVKGDFIGSPAFDTAIYRGNDLIAIIQSQTNILAVDFVTV